MLPAAPLGEKYEDIAGLVLPPDTQLFLDTWKRPEELVLNCPDVPMVLTVPLAAPELAGKESRGKNVLVVLSRELEGALAAGHRTFDWLQAVFIMVISAQVRGSGACHAGIGGYGSWSVCACCLPDMANSGGWGSALSVGSLTCRSPWMGQPRARGVWLWSGSCAGHDIGVGVCG